MEKNTSKEEKRIKVLQKKNAVLQKKIMAFYEAQIKRNKQEIADLKAKKKNAKKTTH